MMGEAVRKRPGADADLPENRSAALSKEIQTASSVTGGKLVEFEEFYRDQMPRLVAFLLLQGAGQMAVDIAQDAMIKVYSRWGEIAFPKTYVRTVSSRAWQRSCRGLAREEPMSAEVVPGQCAADDILVEIISRDAHRHYLSEIAKLPGRQREVIAWAFDDYRPSEIADILGISADSVRASLYKARATLSRYRVGES